MLNTSGLLYLSARAVSAAGNLLAVAIFSRLAGPAEYGHYVLIFAWSLIVYGFGAQWMRFAYFGVYHHERLGEYVASLARLLGAGIAMVALVLAALGLFGFFEPSFLIAVFALVCGITVYEAAFEVARTLLNARGASLSMILRTVLMIGFGSASLYAGGGARGLAVAIAVAHLIAAAPSLATFSNVRLSHFSRAASWHIVSYGWPLLLSFGVTALGQSIDRLLLAHYLGLATLGPYGVVADVLRQSFTVLGEAIILSLVTVAKTQANRGDQEAANQTLQMAFNACLAAASFGAAFFIVFGHVVLQAILQPEFIAPTRGLIPILAIAFAFATMRNFYFAQVIYFTNASYLDLIVALLFLAVSTALSVVLVPADGPQGAAIALMVACVVACVAFMVLGRRWYRMPIDLTALGVMPSLAILFVFGAHMTGELLPGHTLPLVVDAVRLRRVRRLCDPSFRPVALAVGGDRRRTHNGALADALITRHCGAFGANGPRPAAGSPRRRNRSCRISRTAVLGVDASRGRRRHRRGLRLALSLPGDAERLSRGRGARGAGALAADLSGGLAVGLRQPHRAGAGAARSAGIAAGHRQRPCRGVARPPQCGSPAGLAAADSCRRAAATAPKRRCMPPIRT